MVAIERRSCNRPTRDGVTTAEALSPFRETVDEFLVSSFYYTIKGWMNMRCIVNGCSRGAIVVSIERLGWDALEKFSGEDAQERPGEIEGVVNVASLVALVDKLALKLV